MIMLAGEFQFCSEVFYFTGYSATHFETINCCRAFVGQTRRVASECAIIS